MSAPVFDFISIPAFLLAWGIHFSLGGVCWTRFFAAFPFQCRSSFLSTDFAFPYLAERFRARVFASNRYGTHGMYFLLLFACTLSLRFSRASNRATNLSPTSLLFGKAFIRLAHRGKQQKPDSRALAIAAMGSAIAMPFFCFILSVASCQSLGEGMLWGAAFGLFFDSGLNVSHSFFENRPFALFVLHRGYHACSLMLVGGALGAFCGVRVQ